jgi:hypothetical protein
MSSLSLSRIPRPYQFALLAVLVVAALWFLVLQKMVNSSSSETPAPAVHPPTNVHRVAPPPSAAPGAHHAAAPGAPATHAKAPATSPTHAPAGASAKHAAAAAKSQSASANAQHKPAAAAAPAAAATHAAATTHAPAASTVNESAGATGSTGVTGSTTPIVNTINGQLAANQIVLVLFWQPGSTTDQFVQRELVAAGHLFGNHVAVHEALASQVTEFGVYTQKVLINETPTIMMITPVKAVTTLAGYTTSPSIATAIEEAGGKRSSTPAPSHHSSKSHK